MRSLPRRCSGRLRFEASTGAVGFGLPEHGFFGTFAKYGMTDAYGGAS